MKYIVKNCPAFCDSTRQCRGAYDRKISHQYCSGNNDTDCLIKQIVELCKKEKEPICTIENDNGTSTTYFKNDTYLANKILDLLEIEEVDE